MSSPARCRAAWSLLQTLPAGAPAHRGCSAPFGLTMNLRSADSGSTCALASGVSGSTGGTRCGWLGTVPSLVLLQSAPLCGHPTLPCPGHATGLWFFW